MRAMNIRYDPTPTESTPSRTLCGTAGRRVGGILTDWLATQGAIMREFNLLDTLLSIHAQWSRKVWIRMVSPTSALVFVTVLATGP